MPGVSRSWGRWERAGAPEICGGYRSVTGTYHCFFVVGLCSCKGVFAHANLHLLSSVQNHSTGQRFSDHLVNDFSRHDRNFEKNAKTNIARSLDGVHFA
jgi:hypothetical protein